MSKFVPFNGKGLCHYNRVDKGFLCSFCSKSFGSFDLYEEHWPKCTGVCAERPFKPFEQPTYPKFPSSFAAPKPVASKPAASKPDGSKPAAAAAAAAAAAPPKEAKAGDAPANPKNNSNSKKDNKKKGQLG